MSWIHHCLFGTEEDKDTHADWIAHVQRCARLKKWEDETAFQCAVVQLLVGAADNSQSENPGRTTQKELADYFKLIYDPPNAATYYQEKIIGIRQKRNETMRAFNARFRTLLRRLREASPHGFSGKTLLTFYKKSLQDEIERLRPADMTYAFEKSITAERIKRISTRSTHSDETNFVDSRTRPRFSQSQEAARPRVQGGH
jgi:hypothetical protein